MVVYIMQKPCMGSFHTHFLRLHCVNERVGLRFANAMQCGKIAKISDF